MNALLLAVSIAAALAVPALAQKAPVAAAPAKADAMSPDSAVAAVDAAAKEAAQGAARIGGIPVEFARALIVMPYGPEGAPPRDPTEEQVRRIIAAKRAYWTRVHDSIAQELAKTPDDEPLDEAVSYVGPNTARKMALSHHLVDCNKILADIEADATVDAKTPGQSIIDRKKALFDALAPRRAPADDGYRGPCP
jgi:hypothetical protein